MTSDQYVASIISKYSPRYGIFGMESALKQASSEVEAVAGIWADKRLLKIVPSGSYAKRTAIKGLADLDLFISLKHDTPDSLSDIYDSLAKYCLDIGYKPRLQNVSIGIEHRGFKIDLVPGVSHGGLSNDHSIFISKANTWQKTNIQKHINLVSNSGRLQEIRATKIWKYLNGLEFPSLLLELAVIKSLSGYSKDNLANNVLHVLDYLANNFENARFEDPANKRNIISNDLTADEKKTIAFVAKLSRSHSNWESIIW